MRIDILLFASFREYVGKDRMTIDVPVGTKVADTLHYIGADPTLAAKYEPSLLFAVNRTYATRETVLCEGDEVALIPPVAGG